LPIIQTSPSGIVVSKELIMRHPVLNYLGSCLVAILAAITITCLFPMSAEELSAGIRGPGGIQAAD
jgi:hypothetical protein